MTTCPQGHPTTAEDYCDVCGAPVGQEAPAPTPAPAPTGGSSGPDAGTTATVRTCPHCSAANVADALFCEACGYDFTTGTVPRDPAAATGAPPRDVPDDLALPATDPMEAVDLPAAVGPAGTEPGPVTADQTAVTPGLAGPAGDGGRPAPAAPGPGTPTTDAPTAEVPAAGVPAATSDETPWVAEVWIDPDWYALQNSADPMPSPGLPEVVVLRGRSQLVGRVSRSRDIHPEIACEADSGVSRRQAQLTTDGSRWFVEDLGSANGTFVGPASGPLPERPVQVGQRVEIGPDDRVYVGAWTRLVVRRATPGEVDPDA